jgi:Helicase associated domain
VKRETLPTERRQRLDAIGFDWDPKETAWREAYEALKKFRTREGHCRVRGDHVEGTIRLGRWVEHQRENRDTMPAERKRRLDEIGFVWGVLESKWEKGFAALTMFKAREGHCRVPALHLERKFKLGQWVRVQRQSTDTMPADRRQRLDAIGFVWRAK